MMDHMGPHWPAAWSVIAAWQNAFLLLLDVGVVAVFGVYAHARLRMQAEVTGWLEALRWRQPSTNAALALTAYFGGMTVVRAGLWMVRFDYIETGSVIVMTSVGLAIAITGVICLLRVFSFVPLGARVPIIFIVMDLMLSGYMVLS